MENLFLFLAYALNTLLLLLGFLFSLKRKRIYSLLWATLTILQILSIFRLKDFLDEFGLNAIVYGQVLMIPANLLFLLVVASLDIVLLKNRTITAINSGQGQYKTHLLNRLFFVSLVIGFSSLMLRFRHGVSVILSNWATVRASLDYGDSFGTMLGFIYFPSIWLALKEKRYLLSIILCFLGLILFQIIGSRAMLLTLFCAIYIDLLRLPIPYLKKLLLLIVLGMVGFGLHTFTRLVRGLGLATFFAMVTSGGLFTHIDSYDLDLSGGESEIYRYYNYVIDKDYDCYPYKSGITMNRLALIYFPRSIFPELKPVDITYQIWSDALQDGIFDENPYLGALVENSRTGSPGSLHPTLWGDAYVNMDIWGIFFYPLLFSFVLIAFEYCILRLSYVSLCTIASVISVGYLMVGRGNLVIGFGYIAYIVPIVLVIFWLTKIPVYGK